MEEQREEWSDMVEQIRSESRLLRQQTEAVAAEIDRTRSRDASMFGSPPRPPAVPPPPERVYVYAPREHKCPRFSGDRQGQTGIAEDWIREVRKALVGQPLTPKEQVTWVYDLLDGEAKREVTFSLDLEQVCVEDIFTVLLEHFGCDQSYVAIQQQFFHRRQGEKETLREFTQALVTLLQQLQKKDPRVVPLPDMVLRDTFVENIFNTKLHQELTQVLRAHPEHTFREVRDIALRWERRQVVLGATRCRPDPTKGTSPATVCVATVDPATTSATSKEIEECREALRKQQQQLDLILQKLTISVGAPWDAPPPLLPRPAPRQRPLPFQPDGTPICLRCREPGHMARHCPRGTNNHRPTTTATAGRDPAPRPAENSHPATH